MANPSVTEPGGTSRVTAEVVNPDSIPLTFSWVASGGSISGAEAQALWVAPQSTGEFTISVVIKDSKGRTASGSIGVYVQAASSSKPAPTPTPTAPKITTLTADPAVTEPSGTSSITAEVANPDNVPLTFSWVASGGNISGAEARALWVAPQSTGEFTISVIAKDSYGRTASGSIGVNVQASSSAPAPTPTPTGTRDPRTWPFDTRDIWNMPIGSGAVFASIVSPAWNGDTANFYFTGRDYGISINKASTSDPLRTLTVSRYAWLTTDPNDPKFPVAVNGGVYSIRIPNSAEVPPPVTFFAGGGYQGNDQIVLILDPDGKTVHDMHLAYKGPDGNWKAYDYRRHDITKWGYAKSPHGTDFGDGDPRVPHRGHMASGMTMLGGKVRAGELANGIKHALGLIVGVKMMNQYGPGGRAFVWPASSADIVPPSTEYGTTGNVYMGSLLAIPPSVNLDALPFQTVAGKNVARALQQYGGYVHDGDAGFNAMIARIDMNVASELPNQGVYPNSTPFGLDLRLAAKYLKVVVNNGPNSIGGGGTPLAPLAPPFAQTSRFDKNGGHALAFNPQSPPYPTGAIPLAASVTVLLPLKYLRAPRNRRR